MSLHKGMFKLTKFKIQYLSNEINHASSINIVDN